MRVKIFVLSVLCIAMASCNRPGNESNSHDGHHGDGEHDEVKFQYTAYSNDFEVFAEADAFVVGESANVLSHFSTIPGFKAVESGKMTIILSVNGKETTQTLDKPTRKGIYSFDITPDTGGEGSLRYVLTNQEGTFEIVVPEITVFTGHEAARAAADAIGSPSMTNSTVFTKEQSWKVDFATSLPQHAPVGHVIKTTALVGAAQGNEQVIIAKTSGVVVLTSNTLLEGKEVASGQVLFSIVGGTADNHLSVKFAEAKSNFEKAASAYKRGSVLASDKIVSAKDLEAAKHEYENAKAVYDNLKQGYDGSGQAVSTSMGGYIKQVFVKNGSFVEAGQPLVTVAQDKTLQLTAEVAQRYAPVLPFVKTANIRTMGDGETYTFEQLNGKVLSYGKAANADNYLIPVNLQIDNKGSFVSGSFAEVYLIAATGESVLALPNTSLLEEQGTYFVWVQLTPELFEKREVGIGSTDGVYTHIKSGIALNERVVIRGAMTIKLAQATGALDAHSGHVH